jgi:hypothetical protein
MFGKSNFKKTSEEYDKEKADIFSLGLTMLSTLTLISLDDRLDMSIKRFKDKLDKLLLVV